MLNFVIEFNAFFQPRSLALLGASADRRKWGFRILRNIQSGGFEGNIYPVNPKGGEILGLKAYTGIKEIPEVPDLAVIVVPPESIIETIRECAEKGIKAGVVITAGFAEVDDRGLELQRKMVETAHKGGMALIGPNCFGILSPWHKLYSQMPPVIPPAGPIAVVSQSGNVGFTIARRAMATNFGISRLVSTGNEADLHAEDILEFLADDPETKVILSYIEGFKDGRRFFEIASRVTRKKPIVMIKVGETEAGALAARSHTAALSGSDTVVEAMCRQAGIIRVRNLIELANVGYGFLCQPIPRGKRVGIVTTGGGWGVLAADACSKLGLEVVKLPPAVIAELDAMLPAWWSRNNPVDLVAGSSNEGMQRVVEILAQCDEIDGILKLGIIPPWETWSAERISGMSREDRYKAIVQGYVEDCERTRETSARFAKPIYVATELPIPKGDRSIEQEVTTGLGLKHLVIYGMPHEAAMVFNAMASYSQYLNK